MRSWGNRPIWEVERKQELPEADLLLCDLREVGV